MSIDWNSPTLWIVIACLVLVIIGAMVYATGTFDTPPPIGDPPVAR